MVERIMATKIGQQELKPLDKQFDEVKGWADDMARRTPGDPGGGRGTQANFVEIDPRDKPVSINEPPWVHRQPEEDPHNPKPVDYQENPKSKENEQSRKEQLEDEQRRAERAEKQSAEGFSQGIANNQPQEEGASKRRKQEDDQEQKKRDREQEEERKRRARQDEEEEKHKEPNRRHK